MQLTKSYNYSLVDNEKTGEGSYKFNSENISDSNQDLTAFLANPTSQVLNKFRLSWYDRKLYVYTEDISAPIDIFEMTGIPKADCGELLIVGKLKDASNSNSKLGFFDLSINGATFGKMNHFNIGCVAEMTGDISLTGLTIPAGYKFELYILIGRR